MAFKPEHLPAIPTVTGALRMLESGSLTPPFSSNSKRKKKNYTAASTEEQTPQV